MFSYWIPNFDNDGPVNTTRFKNLMYPQPKHAMSSKAERIQ